MELIVISNSSYFKNEGNLINNLFINGLKTIHLRKENTDKSKFVELLNEIDPAFYPHIALHQFHELAPDFGINRLHYPEKLRRESPSFPSDSILSTSIHDWDTLSEIIQFDYAFFSPLFDSLSKPGYEGVIREGFKLPETSVKIVALGGINHDNAQRVIDMGFNGMALMGTLWNDPRHTINNFKKIQEIC
ncbi:thiamine phosphate synthase [Pedobacter frigoris]|uniref:Thiamine phosphate synthase n=1 Tax=Pedobacter frigoris TaxID=2571272 RepID=A0A4U1CGS1_9SPHI|nr:thiamine phosphate synthase [Pedobacter frigoris]TKC05924.1 thiamine phosphate synthase [Pedobacter frigoris]